jgi:biopolymer transport protein ExbD
VDEQPFETLNVIPVVDIMLALSVVTILGAVVGSQGRSIF